MHEWGAARASAAVWRILTETQLGVTEHEAASVMGYAGEVLSAHMMYATGDSSHPVIGLRSPGGRIANRGDGVTAGVGYWGGLSARAGLIADHDEAFLKTAAAYFDGLIAWYEAADIGVAGEAVFAAVTERLARGGLRSALNPGHLTGHDEWIYTPIRPGSAERIASGMPFQVDIIPTPMRAGWALNCEDGVVFADAALRAELKARHPAVAQRIEAPPQVCSRRARNPDQGFDPAVVIDPLMPSALLACGRTIVGSGVTAADALADDRYSDVGADQTAAPEMLEAAGFAARQSETLMTQSIGDQNPLLQSWTGPFEAPPFDRIEPTHFRPAFDVALKDHRAEIDAIAANPEAPTFANTIDALERSGRSLDRVAKVFFNLAGAATNDELQAIEREIAPVLARHRSQISLNEALFKRIDALKARQDKLGLSAEQARVLERYHLDFTRAGAGAPGEAKARLAAIAERLATLAAQFGQNVLADEKDWLMLLDEEDLAGLPDFYVASAARIAAERGHPEHFAVTLGRSSIEPFLQFSARRDLRENAFRAWAARGESGGASDNRAIAAEMVSLRAERARLLGYESFAHYRLADTMAKTPQNRARSARVGMGVGRRQRAER